MMWTVHTKIPQIIIHQTAVCVGNTIYAFGRMDLGGGGDFSHINTTVYIMNTETYSWRIVRYEPRMDDRIPRLDYPAVTVVYGDKIYMCGGVFDDENIIWCFNTQTLRWEESTVTTGDNPFVSLGHTVCVINNYMYHFGGHIRHLNINSNNIHRLNLDTRDWEYIDAKGELPWPTVHASSVAVDGKIYIFGGNESSENILYCFDTVTETWMPLQTFGIPLTGRYHPSTWVHNDFIYIYGGYENRNGHVHYVHHLQRFSLKDNTFENITANGSQPRSSRPLRCVANGNSVFVFGEFNWCCLYHYWLRISYQYNNMHVLEYFPTLETMSIVSLLENKINMEKLPSSVRYKIEHLFMPSYGLCPIQKSYQNSIRSKQPKLKKKRRSSI